MITKVQKWGNSQGLRLNRQVLEDARLAVGDAVDVSVQDGTIVIAPVSTARGRYTIEELVARIPKGYKAEEVAWGQPVGKEAW